MVLSSWLARDQRFLHRAVSSCSTLLGSLHRNNITTVEGIGSKDKPHPLQTRLAECHAVQCGFDSPGVVVSMYCLLLNKEKPSMAEVEACQVGNLSRCSGYRAVLEAFKVFTQTGSPGERASLEERLPAALRKDDIYPVMLKGKEAPWFRVNGG